MKKFLKNILENILRFVELFLKHFISFDLKEMKADQIKETITSEETEVAILIQGPFVTDKNFTIESIKIYRKFFPNSPIIYSGWTDTDASIRSQLEKYKVITVYSDLPSQRGKSNVNYQVCSTLAGVKTALNNQIKYIVKTRSDHRMCSAESLDFLKSLYSVFTADTPKIVGLADNSYELDCYRFSDRLMFGETKEMYKYWDCLYQEEFENEYPELSKIWRNQNESAHSLLFMQYMMKSGRKPNWNIEQYHSYLASNFILFDSYSINLFWFKYFDRFFVSRNFYNSKALTNIQMKKFTFSKWLSLYSTELQK